MNKHQQKQIEILKAHLAIGNIDSAAMGLSALIRSAMTKKQSQALMQIAEEFGIINHPEFII
jgi:hypothetical protein